MCCNVFSGEGPRLARHMSSDSMSSLNSLSSACSATSHQSSATEDSKKKSKQDGKKKNWVNQLNYHMFQLQWKIELIPIVNENWRF